jgi:hypothetical protein
MEEEPIILFNENLIKVLINTMLICIMYYDRKDKYVMIVLLRELLQKINQVYDKIEIHVHLAILNNDLIKKMEFAIEKVKNEGIFKSLWSEIISQLFMLYMKSFKTFGDAISTHYKFNK